ncbi:hypothetical protein ACHAAC_08785 [Aeromicrobium sp. CF4.19]|uniref:hypothetical protein n=1 Tax=Aeromicrobium sp. CF4.19 TaxID=3373082 RepID=UPI003EE6BEF6
MRTFGSAVLWLVAVVAIGVTLPTAWVATHVADEDGYVSFTAPFATDTELQDALTTGVSDSLVASVDLPIGEGVVRELVAVAFTRILDDPSFPDAWQETQRASHRATFEDGAEPRIVLDVAPLVALVGESLADDVPVSIETPEQIIVPVTQTVEPETIETVRDAPGSALLGGGVAVVATLGSLLLARRRSTALGWWGLGVAGIGGTFMLATNRAVPDLLSGQPTDSELGTTMRDLLVARATTSFDEWLLVAVVVGGAATLVGFGSRILSR